MQQTIMSSIYYKINLLLQEQYQCYFCSFQRRLFGKSYFPAGLNLMFLVSQAKSFAAIMSHDSSFFSCQRMHQLLQRLRSGCRDALCAKRERVLVFAVIAWHECVLRWHIIALGVQLPTESNQSLEFPWYAFVYFSHGRASHRSRSEKAERRKCQALVTSLYCGRSGRNLSQCK